MGTLSQPINIFIKMYLLSFSQNVTLSILTMLKYTYSKFSNVPISQQLQLPLRKPQILN